MPNWNPIQYEKFLKDRTQPAIDLANRLEEFAPNTAYLIWVAVRATAQRD